MTCQRYDTVIGGVKELGKGEVLGCFSTGFQTETETDSGFRIGRSLALTRVELYCRVGLVCLVKFSRFAFMYLLEGFFRNFRFCLKFVFTFTKNVVL